MGGGGILFRGAPGGVIGEGSNVPWGLLAEEIVRNFERTFTPRGWLRSAPNLGKTRFRASPTFKFSTPKTSKLCDLFENVERPFTPRG